MIMDYENTKLSIMIEKNNYFFCKSESQYAILKNKDNENINNINIGNIKYISKFISEDGKAYELIFFNENIKEDIALSFFEILVKINKDLPKTLDEISMIFSFIYKDMDLWKKRGIFAELFSIIEYNLKPRNDKNSIYDMLTLEGNDAEIKSFSKTKREVQISYQQLSNNNNALFYMFEVIESSNGKTIVDMYNILPHEYKARYSWIEYINSDNDKFEINNNSTIICNSKKLNVNLLMPKFCKNAYFVFDVDLIKESLIK